MRAKRYNTETYEKKLATVMTRLGIEKYNYDYTRRAAWVTFAYKGQNYRFVENAAAHGQPLSYGSDAFCQIVLTLEDLARASNRGIYDLQTWVEGILRALPCHEPLPGCFSRLGFTDAAPKTADEVQKAFRIAAKAVDQTSSDSSEMLRGLMNAREEALRLIQQSV